jgi:hypothetical protein
MNIRPMHRNDQGAFYADRVRPMPGHDPRDTVSQCPTCQAYTPRQQATARAMGVTLLP